MNHSEEIKNLQISINNLLTQNSLLITRTQLLESLVFDIAGKVYPERLNEIYTLFVDSLEQHSKQMLEGLEECYYNIDDPAFSIRQRFDALSLFASMKDDDRYLHKAKNPDAIGR